jgi:preprotein translocase subunit SecF
MLIQFLKFKKIFYVFSIIAIILSITSIFIFKLELGIDFTGGSMLEVEYEDERPSIQLIQDKIKEITLEKVIVQPVEQKGIILKTKDTSEEMYAKAIEKLKELGTLKQDASQFETIGPVIGNELKDKTKIVIILSLMAIVFYIAYSFRKISRPVNSFAYGFTSLIALCHDVLIPLGIFAFLGKLYGVQITIPVITAFLTVLGYSINNSVVVFDRARENLLRSREVSFGNIINKSLNETLTRSINTSLTTLFVLFAIFFFGGETLRYFSLTLILGISCGTYSSIFLVTPLLVTYLEWREKRLH